MTAFDPGADLAAVADHLEAVTIKRRGTAAVESVPLALRSSVSQRQSQQSGGKFATTDVEWHLPTAELEELPRLGDVIVAGSERWTILAIERTTLAGRLRCTCRNLAVAFGLTDGVRIQRAAWTKGIAGAQRAVWHDEQVGLAARIVLERLTVDDPEQQFLLRRQYKIYLAEPVEIEDGQRVVDESGRAYQIIEYERKDGFDAPSVVTAIESVTQ